MRASKFTDEEITLALQRVAAGTRAVEVCRELGITQTTFYRWRARFDGVALGEVQEVRHLRDENLKLKQIIANLLLEKQALADPRRSK